jgi:hypothetical protein
VDDKSKLYTDRQFNWEFDEVSKLVPFKRTDEGTLFLAVAGQQGRIVKLDAEAGKFVLVSRHDLTGLNASEVSVGDVDGDKRPDILLYGPGVIHVLLHENTSIGGENSIVFNARTDNFMYWNFHVADLDGDEQDEVLLFDNSKAMFEVYRADAQGELKVLLRQRLFERSIHQQRETNVVALPQDVCVGDVDGNGKPDFLCIMQDRIAIYLHGAK